MESSDERRPLLQDADQQPLYIEEGQREEEEVQTNGGNTRSLKRFLKKIPLIAYILVTLACVVMTLAGVFVKILTDTGPFLLTSYRNCIIFLLSMPRLAYRRINPWPRENKKFLLTRAVLSSFYTMFLYYSFRHMPLGDARTITATHPIFVTLFACIALGESCGIFEIVSLIFTMSGMAMILHPQFIFGGGSAGYDTQYFIAAGLSIAGVLFQAGGFVVTRAIKDMDYTIVTAWNGLIGAFPPLFASIILGDFYIPTTNDSLYALLIGVLSFIGQTMVTLALQLEEAGTVSLVIKADDILLAFLIQIVYFGNNPDAMGISGATLIMSSILASGGRKIIDKKSNSALIRKAFCLTLPLESNPQPNEISEQEEPESEISQQN